MKNQIFSPKKKFSDLQNLHPGVFRGAEADFEGPGAQEAPAGAGQLAQGGARPALLGGRRNGVSPLNISKCFPSPFLVQWTKVRVGEAVFPLVRAASQLRDSSSAAMSTGTNLMYRGTGCSASLLMWWSSASSPCAAPAMSLSCW